MKEAYMRGEYKDSQYREAARRKHGDDIEVDIRARVARGGEKGAFVHAWVWISDDDVAAETRIANDLGAPKP